MRKKTLSQEVRFIKPISCCNPCGWLSQNQQTVATLYTVEPVYSGHLGTSLKCLVSLHVNGFLGPLPSVLIMEVTLFSNVPINRFQCTMPAYKLLLK